MGDSLITVVAILLAAILMFIFPMMAMSERNDDVSELAVQTAVAEFVNNAERKIHNQAYILVEILDKR